MIISHKHRFIFIKTNKTAGTSIEIALSLLCGDDDILTPLSPIDEKKRFDLTGRTAQNFQLNLKSKSKQFLKGLTAGKRYPLQYYNHIGASDIKSMIGK